MFYHLEVIQLAKKKDGRDDVPAARLLSMVPLPFAAHINITAAQSAERLVVTFCCF